MATPEEYPWLRRDGESPEAYDAFRRYLHMGPNRALRALAEDVGKSQAIVNRWSARDKWQDRVLAYDRHMELAQTDGHADELARLRTRHMEISDKLLDHLDRRLDTFIVSNVDPTVRWTQAFVAAVKAQEAAVTRLRDDGKVMGALERAMELLGRLSEAGE